MNDSNIKQTSGLNLIAHEESLNLSHMRHQKYKGPFPPAIY